MIRQYAFLPVFLLLCAGLGAQSFRVEDLQDRFANRNPFRLSGGFSANTVWNGGNETQGRDPFAYYLNGDIHLNLYGLIRLPFSFRLTNSSTSYQLPSTPNRLSISPSYKWITGHFGDVSLSFSPYTLNGRLFTGAGVELKPRGWELTAMYGRLQRSVESDALHPEIQPVYRRLGYGVKAGRTGEQYEISLNVLNAMDIASSLAVPPDSLGITPMENVAGSVAVMYKPTKHVNISGEYGLSLLTQDRRAFGTGTRYHAFKLQVDVAGGNDNSIGIGYERIDPNYQTLGAYYFVNDIENITANASQTFWQKKMNLSISLGYEHDNLNHIQTNATARMVGSALLTTKFSDRVNATVSYSNFHTYAHVRSNFELINQENPLDLLDTLHFVQLSQSANLLLNFVVKKHEKQVHHLNITANYQDAANRQGGIYRPGSITEMINASTAYSISFPQSGFSINGALYLNNSKIRSQNTLTCGPSIGASASLFKKKVNLTSSFSFNSGLLEGVKQNDVLIGRWTASYLLAQRHNFNLSYAYQRRSAVDLPVIHYSLLTAGYAYHF